MKAFIVLTLILTSVIICDEMARVRVGKRFIDDVFNTLMPGIVEQLNQLGPVDKDIDTSFLWIFPFHANVRNLTLDPVHFNKSQYSINFNQDYSAIDVYLNNFNIRAKSTIFHKVLFFSNSSGVLDANMNINLHLSLAVGTDSYGNFQLSLNNYDFNYKGSSFSFQGSIFEGFIEFMVNWFEFFVEFIVRQVIRSSVKDILSSLNSNLQNEISIPSTNSTVQIKQDKISIDQNHLDLSTKFNFKHKNLARRQLQMVGEGADDDTEDFQVLVNHDLMNSISKSFFLAKMFHLEITSKIVPDDIPFRINTKYFQHVIPGIYDKYPDQELSINLNITQQPSFVFNKGNQSIEFKTTAFFTFTLINNTKSILSFDSDIYFDLRLGANYTDPSVHLSIKNLEIQRMTIIASEFPALDINLLKTNLNFTFTLVSNAANKFYLVNGIPFPIIKGLKFKKVVTKVEDTYFSFTIQPDVSTSKFTWLKLY